MGVGSDRTIPVRLSTIPPSAWHADSAGKAARCSAQPVWPVVWLVVFHTQHGGRDAALRRPRAVQARNVRPSAWPPSQGQRTRFRRCTRRGRRSAPSLPEQIENESEGVGPRIMTFHTRATGSNSASFRLRLARFRAGRRDIRRMACVTRVESHLYA